MEDLEKCWCGSGKNYCDCHKNFDIKLEEKKQQGYLIPPKKFIKNEKQIEGKFLSKSVQVPAIS